MIWTVLGIITGFVCLIYGANLLVAGASLLAKRYGVPDLIIGLSIVALGTSAPELVVNLLAAYDQLPDIVLSNIIGSNNFNLFMILGLAAIMVPLQVQKSTAFKEIPLAWLSIILLGLLANNFFISSPAFLSRLDACLLLTAFIGFMYYLYLQVKKDVSNAKNSATYTSIKSISVKIILGLAGLFLGGQLVVNQSVSLAQTLGLSEKIIGLTIIAAGTSLPELVTTLVSARQNKADLAVGNVIGSNLFNFLLILPASILINPIDYNLNFNIDIILLLIGTSFVFLAMFTGKRRKIDRWEALTLVLVYLAFTIYFVNLEV
jgi:cation:H+ antiporter